MTPDTVHFNAQLIRHGTETVRAIERWLQRQPRSDTQIELFRTVSFWKRILKHAERELAQVNVVDVPAAVSR